MSLKNITISSDILGAMSSGLCLIHCLATPFIFIAQSCTAASSCCDNAPIAWSMIDYFFIAISFFAVRWSTKTTSKNWIKYALWISWVTTFIMILNERMDIFSVPRLGFYIPALALVILHLYNRKYCQCYDDACCIQT